MEISLREHQHMNGLRTRLLVLINIFIRTGKRQTFVYFQVSTSNLRKVHLSAHLARFRLLL